MPAGQHSNRLPGPAWPGKCEQSSVHSLEERCPGARQPRSAAALAVSLGTPWMPTAQVGVRWAAQVLWNGDASRIHTSHPNNSTHVGRCSKLTVTETGRAFPVVPWLRLGRHAESAIPGPGAGEMLRAACCSQTNDALTVVSAHCHRTMPLHGECGEGGTACPGVAVCSTQDAPVPGHASLPLPPPAAGTPP